MTTTTHITVFAANCRGNPANCLYPNRIEITDADSAAEAFSRDIVCAEYRNNYRNIDNFLISNALPMDCDNDHTEDPKMWITAEDIHEIFRNVPHIIHYSRHHMKSKGDYSARPRFHVVFLIDPEADPDIYAKQKQRLRALFPFFDPMALDAARFLIGTENPEVKIHHGTMHLFVTFPASVAKNTLGFISHVALCTNSLRKFSIIDHYILPWNLYDGMDKTYQDGYVPKVENGG